MFVKKFYNTSFMFSRTLVISLRPRAKSLRNNLYDQMNFKSIKTPSRSYTSLSKPLFKLERFIKAIFELSSLHYFNNNVKIYGQPTQDNSFEFGNAINSDDLDINILSEANIENYGYVKRNNVC